MNIHGAWLAEYRIIVRVIGGVYLFDIRGVCRVRVTLDYSRPLGYLLNIYG